MVSRDPGLSNFSIFSAFQVLPGPSALVNGNWKGTMSVNMKSTWQGLQRTKKWLSGKRNKKAKSQKICIKINPNDLNSYSYKALTSKHPNVEPTPFPTKYKILYNSCYRDYLKGTISWKYINIYSFPPFKKILDWKSSEY